MKVFAFMAIAALVIVGTNASLFTETPIEKVDVEQFRPEAGEVCSLCIQFMGSAINALLNIIANGGILEGCKDLCEALPKKLEATVCDLLCDFVGIKEFIKAIEAVDPDPFSLCMEINICPIKNNAAGAINDLSVTPSSGAQGTTFDVTLGFSITNETGTGEVSIQVKPPNGPGFGETNPLIDTPVGTYSGTLKFSSKPTEQEFFPPGTYSVEAMICEGMCGSKHKDSYTMATKVASFTITQ